MSSRPIHEHRLATARACEPTGSTSWPASTCPWRERPRQWRTCSVEAFHRALDDLYEEGAAGLDHFIDSCAARYAPTLSCTSTRRRSVSGLAKHYIHVACTGMLTLLHA
ncbi:MAG: hypothetical protein M1399_06270 [Actinobacteria bacterium]|nr:hypothetical protein [Actinomycetota bacterium]